MKLSDQLFRENYSCPQGVEWVERRTFPERVLQFGEGNFLRGFVDWMIHEMNLKGLFNGQVVVVQPVASGMAEVLNAQNGLYTLILRGIQDGKVVNRRQIIQSISRLLSPYADLSAWLLCAENPDLRFIVSNTTEAGISYSASDKPTDQPPASFPAKVAVFLHKRYQHFSGDPGKGFVFLPCELIDRNGDKLKELVVRYAHEWGLGTGFIEWIRNSNDFLNTLVDRIVSGYPKDEAAALCQELGYEDQGLDTAEIFHSWVIEGRQELAQELPFAEAGLNVVWTSDMTPFRTRKVRILNGAHTMMALAAYLLGKDTVKECMDDPLLMRYFEQGVYQEIIPTLELPKEDLTSFASAVAERFSNPFIQHLLLSISLNSVSKFKVRCLPSLLDFLELTGKLPQTLVFSLAGLIAFYRGTEIRDNVLLGSRDGKEYHICDDVPILLVFQSVWTAHNKGNVGVQELVRTILGKKEFWDQDLNAVPGLTEKVAGHLAGILNKGVAAAMTEILASQKETTR